uniref:PDZ domain-containing protein n=1 Tax=Heliothis virescens TaxID=7102 RepID=A0A2A4K6R3_HELVI
MCDMSEDRFAGYKGVRDITIKKGPSGLGIMIIEGRHTEAGRGIFVSDLQEGSAAEQGGLQIGDMLLAVNRDSLLNCSYDAAAAKLKQTEGVVVLTVCTPNLKEPGDESPAPATPGAGSGSVGGTSRPASRNADALAASRPQTPRPAPSPVKVEPPADPATAPIMPNVDTVIEINSNNQVLGLQLLGGSDTLINGASAIILDIYKDGAIAKDGRLRPGDHILECNGVHITKEMAHERVCLTIKQKTAKLKLTVHRPEPVRWEEVEIDLARKAGRPLGLACVAPVVAPGVYIGNLLPGTPAELDGRIQRGDFLLAVDGKDVSSADLIAAATALKLCANKATIKGASAIILDIYKDGAIAKDGRLRPGDHILECNGVHITKEMAHERVCLTIKQKTAKLKLTVHRPEPVRWEEVEIDLARKAGRPLGLACVAPVVAPGVYIGNLLPGTPAELDGRIQRGDFLLAVDGKDVSSADLIAAATALKLCANKATIKGASAIILDIYKDGAIAKDGRLRPGDHILECNGVHITKEMAHERVCLTIKQKTAKLKLTVHRPEPVRWEEVEIDLARKAGRPLGLACVAPVVAPGVYIGNLLPGTPAELDGRIQRGDFLLAVDGKDVSSADLIAAATALKLCANKATIKVRRYKTLR